MQILKRLRGKKLKEYKARMKEIGIDKECTNRYPEAKVIYSEEELLRRKDETN